MSAALHEARRHTLELYAEGKQRKVPFEQTQPKTSQMTPQTLLLLRRETSHYYKWRGEEETKQLSDELFSTG